MQTPRLSFEKGWKVRSSVLHSFCHSFRNEPFPLFHAERGRLAAVVCEGERQGRVGAHRARSRAQREAVPEPVVQCIGPRAERRELANPGFDTWFKFGFTFLGLKSGGTTRWTKS